MNSLRDQHILLGISGGIAAYKSAALLRLLRGEGADIRVVMTRAATEFVTPLTFQALSGHPVRTELFDTMAEAGMDHIELARWAGLILVAPASADFLARLAGGHANDLLTTLCLASSAPLAVAPAMNRQMWQAAATQENIARLKSRGVHVLGPAEGLQACGEKGPGRMLETAELHQHARTLLAGNGSLSRHRVLVTAGPTREAIDPVRYISNRSSGRMGYAIAAALQAAGADVVLVSGPVSLPTPAGVRRVDVESAAEMLAAVEAEEFDMLIACAAVADYRPVNVASEKIKKDAADSCLSLQRNPDILAHVSNTRPAVFTVGFAAETGNLEEYARGKLMHKKLDMIAANHVGAGLGFEVNENALEVFWKGGGASLPRMEKTVLSQKLVEIILERYLHHAKNTTENS